MVGETLLEYKGARWIETAFLPNPYRDLTMPLSTEEYDKLTPEEREQYDASERQREREEQAGQPQGAIS